MIPSFSQLAIDVTIKAAIGFGIGVLNQSNQKLWALILATQSITNYALSRICQAAFNHKFSAATIKTINESTRAISYLAAIVAINQVGLISLRVAGLFAFFNLAFLLGRMKWFSSHAVS